MKIISHYYGFLFCFISCTLIITACSKMDATYRDFIKDGERIYVGKADSVKILSGKNRVLVQWLAISDPRVVRAKIYWNNRTDSLEIPVHKTVGIDTIRHVIDDLQEGDYSFDIITFDDQGNHSVYVNAIGKVYGDQYQQTLFNRAIQDALYNNGIATIRFGNPQTGTVYTEIRYLDEQDTEHRIDMPASADSIDIEGYKTGTSFRYRTVFMPDSTAIDLFYSSYEEQRIKGAPVEYPKQGWSITASTERAANPAAYAIDNNPGTVWINETVGFPYVLTVDMGVLRLADGFSFVQRTNANGQPANPNINLVDVEVSNDGEEWRAVAQFTLDRIGGVQYFDLPDSEEFRYFRTTLRNAHGDVPNASMAEIGVYYR